ncbi:succinate dehydrogenase cytochrome b subunit [bacterium]|nr:succinate dehydrogenase cytochrome b subunit [bacterium]
MSRITAVLWSSVGKKILTGLTGLFLIGFLVVHLLGNLTIYMGPSALNGYAAFLEGIFDGWFVTLFEIGLIALFLVHISAAVAVAMLDKNRARPINYKKSVDAGGKSRKTFSSTTMIWTGVMLFLFILVHVWMFKLNVPHPEHGGHADYYSVVIDAFKNPMIAGAYVLVMAIVGFHLRHGFWSAFQSMGWNNDRWIGLLYTLGLIVALLLAVGFLLLPVYVYFFLDPSAVSHASLGGL